jgi:hypothetical protein
MNHSTYPEVPIILFSVDSANSEQVLQIIEKLEWKGDDSSPLPKALVRLAEDVRKLHQIRAAQRCASLEDTGISLMPEGPEAPMTPQSLAGLISS